MALCRPGDKPLTEPMIDYRRIYASLGLNELNLTLKVKVSQLQTTGILTKLFSISWPNGGSSLIGWWIIVRTNLGLTRTQTQGHTHMPLGSSHEGSDRHPRQHGGGRGRRFGKFTANSHRVCSFLRSSFCELIVIGVRRIDEEARAAVIRYFATIPVSSFAWWRGCRSCLLDEGVGRPWRGYRCLQMNLAPA